MATRFLVVFLSGAFLFLGGCAPSPSQLKQVIEDNPDILFSAIEKNPKEFLETVNKAAREARAGEEQRMREMEEKAREDEFNNPKQPVITDNRAVLGDKKAPVTIVEYSDFQCPFCRRGSDTVAKILEDYKGKVNLVFKHYPIERIHPQAKLASQYFEAIALQDASKAYKFKSLLFENQQRIKEKEKFLDSMVKEAGADLAAVKKNLNSKKVTDIIAADQAEAEKFGFTGTPGYLINGVSLKGAYPADEFKKIIDRHLKQ